MTTITEEIDRAVEKANGDVRHALNLMMADRDVANALLAKEKRKSAGLTVALEAIRALLWLNGPPNDATAEVAVDKIARDALRVAGETATTTEED